MATRGTGPAEDAPRGIVRHVPVLLPQVLQALAPSAGQSYIDATFGAGGYTAALLDAAAGVRVLAIDRDPGAIAAARPLAEGSGGRSGHSRARRSWSKWSSACWDAASSPAGIRRRARSRRSGSTSTMSWASWHAAWLAPSVC